MDPRWSSTDLLLLSSIKTDVDKLQIGMTYLFWTMANRQAIPMATANKYQFLTYLFNTLLKSIPPVILELTLPTAYNLVKVTNNTANVTRVVNTDKEKVGVIPIAFAFMGSAYIISFG